MSPTIQTRRSSRRAFVFTVSFLLVFLLYVSFVSFYADSVRQVSLDALESETLAREGRTLGMLSSSLQSWLEVRDGFAIARSGNETAGNATTNVTIATRLPTSLSNAPGELHELNEFYNTTYALNLSENAGYANLSVASLGQPSLVFALENRADALRATFSDANRSSVRVDGAAGVLTYNLSGAFNASCQPPNDACNASVLSGSFTVASPCPAGRVRVFLAALRDSGSQTVTVSGASEVCADVTAASGSALQIQFPSNSTFTLNLTRDASLNAQLNASVNASLGLTLNLTTSLNGTLGVTGSIPITFTLNNQTRTSLPLFVG